MSSPGRALGIHASAPVLVCGLGAFVLYLASASPHVASGDVAEFQTLAATGGIAHAGYPLYVLVLRVFALLPFGTMAQRAATVSAVAGASSVALATWYAVNISRRAWVGLAVGVSLASTTILWSEASRAEIYAFTLAITAALFLAARAYLDRPSWRLAALTGFLASWGLVSHLGVLGLLTPLLAIVSWRLVTGRMPVAHLLVALAALLVGLVPPILYVLWQDRAHVPMNYIGDTFGAVPPHASALERIGRVVRLLPPKQYLEGTFGPFAAALPRLRTLLDDAVVNEISVVGLLLGVLGLLALSRRRTFEGPLLGGWIASQLFWLSMAAYWDTLVSFFLPALWAVSLLQAHGLKALMGRPRVAAGCALLLALLPIVRLALVEPPGPIATHPMLAATWREGPVAIFRARRDSSWEAYGRGVMRLLSPNAVILACWNQGTTLRFVHYAEAVRPDVEVRWRCRDAQALQNDVAALEAEGRPVYCSYDPAGLLSPDAVARFVRRWPVGELWRILPAEMTSAP